LVSTSVEFIALAASCRHVHGGDEKDGESSVHIFGAFMACHETERIAKWDERVYSDWTVVFGDGSVAKYISDQPSGYYEVACNTNSH